MTTIHLEPVMVPAQLRSGYSGTKFKAVVGETVHIPMDAGLWSGGSRETYRLVHLETGNGIAAANHNAAPWDGSRRDVTVKLEPGFVVIKHSLFCGKDMGLTFYIHPDNATKLLPAPAELSENENIVLDATCGLKSSYNGRDRYAMKADDYRYSGKPFPTRAEWEIAKQALIAKGMLNKAGAVTVKGRNARPSKY